MGVVRETRVELGLVDHGEVQGFEQPLLGGRRGEVALDVHHVPVDVAAVDHRLQLAVVSGAVELDGDAAVLLEGVDPGLLLRVLRGAAPGREHHVLGGGGAGRALQGDEARGRDQG